MALTISGNGQISTLIGQVCFFAMTTAPAGFIKCNGAAVSRTTYADLFSAIGVTYGAGDGSTTFNLPDMRGEFPRGWDDGRGVDSGRAIGTAQDDMIKNHWHPSTSSDDPYSYGYYQGGTLTSSSGRSSTNYGASSKLDTYPETRPRNVSLLACIKF